MKDCICGTEALNLSQAHTGRRLQVECLHGDESVCQRLREMGFCESSVVEKITGGGSLICKVCDSRVILSKGLADKIIVKDLSVCKGHDHAGK